MPRNFFSCFFLSMSISFISNAQVTEKFDDGDFTNNPVWSGNPGDFIVNSLYQLQSNNAILNGSYFISTPNTLATSVQWELYIAINFNPSSANYIDVFLTSSASDLTAATNTGYFVRIGNTDDEISLYRKDATGLPTKIIDGADGVLNTASNAVKIKVTRDVNNQWALFRDATGTGNAYTGEGFITDATFNSSSFFGFYIKQSTAGFFQKHFFDDIEIKNYVPDITPASIQHATAISPTALDVLFSEPVEKTGIEVVSNYSVDNNAGRPLTATADVTNLSLVHLIFANSFTNAVAYTLTVNGVKDLAGNPLINGNAKFSYYSPQQYDVVIDEIMADPTPQAGLPNEEWIELRNTSLFDINLQGWTLSDLTGQTGEMPGFILEPDSFVIVCGSSAVSNLLPFGKVISVSNFPSLDNDGDLIALSASTGRTMHAVQYNPAWYQNELKKDGGWTLEMKDTKNPCGAISNWMAGTDATGGTPGKKNSVDGISNDENPPLLLRAFAVNNTTITLVYDEPLDSLKASSVKNYAIDNGISAVTASDVSPAFTKVNISLNTPIVAGTVYTITASNITDCKGNIIGSKNIARFGVAEEPDSFDIVINEVLFNPKPGGEDYVELYNRSQKIINLEHIHVANRNSSNVISSIQQVSQESILLFPKDFVVLTSNPDAVKSQYLATSPDAFITLTSIPSFSDDLGNVIILNSQGRVVDEVKYSDKWHFPLITNTEGVSLERIDYDAPSLQSNFHSAATAAGYGTPGYKNSQYRLNAEVQGEIKVTPDIFSPDNDGNDDFATINYSFAAPGYVANMTIFDATGRVVRYLQRNALSGVKGYYRWDGLDDKNQKLPQGIYIIYTEIFNTEGRKKQFKNTIVLARRY
ncbi:MAG: lamin tail domain-containing protein [Ginsengibacter sp.]